MKIIIAVITEIIMFTALSVNAQWIQQTTGTTANLDGISFLNEKTGYVCGSGVILKTTNGGTNWINVNSLNLLKPFTKIQALDENVVYCVGMFKTIIKSTNGGVNWIILRNGPSGTGFSLFALYFINSSTGWIGGKDNTPYIFKTTNGGETFDSIPTENLNQRVQDFYFINASTGLGCNDAGGVRKTTNGGYNWNDVNIPIGTYLPNFRNFSFINNSTGFTCTDNRKVFKTTDFGDNWDSLSYIPNTYPSIHHISFSSESKGWAVGSGYDVFHTTNGGMNWFTQGGGGGIEVNFINDSVGYKTGNSGIIYKTTNGGFATYVTNHESALQCFSLQNAYPNPFNSETRIEFQISMPGLVTIKIYDINGREIETLVNEVKRAGYYTVHFNASRLSSGIYFYRITAADFVSTRKMILIK
ncbi:MAG TPA: YCF48-related protein [Ignavibacteria bacterium]|nr:YCF48-related protein [Ignavibacteria bacterium]